MRSRSLGGAPLLLLAVAVPVLAQAADTMTSQAGPTKSAVSAKRPTAAHNPPRPAKQRKPVASAASLSHTRGALSDTWVKLNTHLLGSVGESTWVNLAQAANIRFYQTGKTSFAAIGVGGSNYVSTSDLAEIQKLRAYVLAHQIR